MDYEKEKMYKVLAYLNLIDPELELQNHLEAQRAEESEDEFDSPDIEPYSIDIDENEYFVDIQSMADFDWVEYPTKKVYHLREKNNHRDYDYKVTFEVYGHSDDAYKDMHKGEIFPDRPDIDIDAIVQQVKKKHSDDSEE